MGWFELDYADLKPAEYTWDNCQNLEGETLPYMWGREAHWEYGKYMEDEFCGFIGTEEEEPCQQSV